MPRMRRFSSPGSLVHIMARGIDGGMIFGEDEDRYEFLRRFALHRSDCGYECYAWCLMPNHYHLLLRTSETPMSTLMRPLNGGYALWFNKKHDRRGYLFQDRFKSVLCQGMDYARELVRYIHLNPLRARIVDFLSDLEEWKWSGHRFLLGLPGSLGAGFQERAKVLRHFTGDPGRSVEAYVQFLVEGIDADNVNKSGMLLPADRTEIIGSSKGWPAVIGDAEFAREAMAKHEVSRWRKHRKADYAKVLKRLAREVCSEHKLKPKDLFCRGRLNSRSDARARFCFRAHFEQLLPYRAIAEFLGTTIPPTIIMARRIRTTVEEERS